MAKIPFWKEKFPMKKYLEKGDPLLLYEDVLPQMLERWMPITQEEQSFLQDAKSVVDQKNKKRDFSIEYAAEPIKMPHGNFMREIKIFHVNYRGIVYLAEGSTVDELEKLLANSCEIAGTLFQSKVKTTARLLLRLFGRQFFSMKGVGRNSRLQFICTVYS